MLSETYSHKNGEKKSEKYFEVGMKNGFKNEWDEGGKKTYEGTFKDGNEE
jgi:antitoxin component YwqK of YwqJK toxin-antitoxin module